MKKHDEWDLKFRPFIPGTKKRFLPDYPYVVVYKTLRMQGQWIRDFENLSSAQEFFNTCNPGTKLFKNDKI